MRVNFPIETEVGDKEGAAGRLCNKQTSSQAVITSPEQQRQNAVLVGGLSRVWAVAVPVEESKSSFTSLLTSKPLPLEMSTA